jgi:hypothetical protein
MLEFFLAEVSAVILELELFTLSPEVVNGALGDGRYCSIDGGDLSRMHGGSTNFHKFNSIPSVILPQRENIFACLLKHLFEPMHYGHIVPIILQHSYPRGAHNIVFSSSFVHWLL